MQGGSFRYTEEREDVGVYAHIHATFPIELSCKLASYTIINCPTWSCLRKKGMFSKHGSIYVEGFDITAEHFLV